MDSALTGGFRACSIAFDLRLRVDAYGGISEMRNLGIVVLCATLLNYPNRLVEIGLKVKGK